jgi:hypothetical protein
VYIYIFVRFLRVLQNLRGRVRGTVFNPPPSREDLADMLADNFETHFRTWKLYMRIFRWFVDSAICDSWLLLRPDVRLLSSRKDKQMILRAFWSEVDAGLYVAARVMP